MQPRYYQVEAHDAFFNYLTSGQTGNPLIGMPTGTGKSLVIAMTIYTAMTYYQNKRVMMLTHVSKLVEQNAKALRNIWLTAPLGINSAELKQRDFHNPIIYGNIQSCCKKAELFGHRDLLFIDEAHLIGPDQESQYAKTISILKAINPNLIVCGFSATLYRMKQGELTDDGLFTDVCYDLTGYQAFNRLVAEGYLAPLIGKPTATRFDISNVKILGGEYNAKQLEDAVDKTNITFEACKEIIDYASEREHWMIFAAGVNHSEHIAEMLNGFGIPAAAVHSKLTSAENNNRLAAFESGQLRAIVGNNKLTTGYDFPPIDFIGDMQPCCSPGKHVQKYGRGTRISPDTGKTNCLVLDFAGNVLRCGPINDPIKPRKPGSGAPGEAPIRICDTCGAYNHASARFCCNCAAEFNYAPKIFRSAGNVEVMKVDDAEILETFSVSRIVYSLHEKKDQAGNLLSPPSMRVGYFCGLRRFDEWINFESTSNLMRHKARDWWRQRHEGEPPPTTFRALQLQAELRQPTKITVRLNCKYPEVKSYEYQ